MTKALARAEREKYEAVWAVDAYRKFSPGEYVLPLFAQMVRSKPGTLVDIGAGTGRAGAALAEKGWQVTLLDHAKNAREVDLPFIRACIWDPWLRGDTTRWDMGYCCDVMEHMPPEKVDATLKRIAQNCRRCFFSIHFGEDNFGKVVGHPLHLTVEGFSWWRDTLGRFGKVLGARDILGMGVFSVAF